MYSFIGSLRIFDLSIFSLNFSHVPFIQVFFFHLSSPVCAAQIILDVWPSSEAWCPYPGHTQQKSTPPLPAAINCQYSSSAGGRTSWPSPVSLLRLLEELARSRRSPTARNCFCDPGLWPVVKTLSLLVGCEIVCPLTISHWNVEGMALGKRRVT